MTPQEFLTKIEAMDIGQDLKDQIKVILSKNDVNNQDLLDVQNLISDSLDQDFKEEGIEADIASDPELKAAYETMDKEMDEAEEEYAKNVAAVKVTSDYLEGAAKQVSAAAEEVRQEDLKKEIDQM